jgi:glycosyltransferase involved in cell wall biosynthesis
MKVVMISRVTMNPYVHLLGDAVAAACACPVAYEDTITPAVAARWRGKADVWHIHWADGLVRGRSLFSSLRKLAALALGLAQARRAGIAIVYTAHNVGRQDDGGGLLGRLAEEIVYRCADAVHVHDDEVRRRLSRPAERVAVIPHGNYIGAYPDTTNRADARKRLGIAPDAFVYLALGQIRPYKGLDELIAAFRTLPGERLRLLIAGHPHDPQVGEALRAHAACDERITLDLRFVPDDEIQHYMHTTDVCVLPYRSGTTSGAAILAFSFARAVIAPDVWPFRGLLAEGGGLLYAPDAGALRRALLEAQTPGLAQRWGEQALAIAHTLDWGDIARQHVDVYRKIAR